MYQNSPKSAESAPTTQPQPSEQATASTVASSLNHNRTPIRKSTQPSCNQCRRRKVKCDRADPCSQCVRAGAGCVFSPPSGAPRGRKGGRRKLGSELLDRIAKLESLVKNIEGGISRASPTVPVAPISSPTVPDDLENRASKVQSAIPFSKPPREEGLDRYLGSSLWMNLSDEIHGMREVLDQSSDGEDEDSVLTPNSSSQSPGHSNFVIFVPDILQDIRNSLQHPNRSQILSLYSSFMTNVDPTVKLLHGPSLFRYLVQEAEEIACSPGPKGWEALKFAIYYTTTTSLTPNECLQQLGEDKMVLLPRYRTSTELALAKADFINTEDMSTLQALVLYLFAVRSNENSRRTWTLTSLAVRIAHALDLHREKVGSKYASWHRSFEREMRRRLWWQICVLDRQASLDRGSDPIITTDSFSTQLPLHVNDEDLIPDDPREVQQRDQYTDMTLSLVCHEAFDIAHRLNYVPAGEFDQSQERTDDTWAQRRGWVVLSQRRIEEKYLRLCDVNVPAQRYTKLVADIIIATLWLFTYRPLQKQPDSPNSVKVPHGGILHLAVEVMEKANQLSKDSCSEPFRWMSTIWVQWHALAVTIAELCVQIEGSTVERAWKVVNPVFEETAAHIADSDKGRLWRPIKKLMNRAQAVRKQHLEEEAARKGSLSTEGALLPMTVPWPNPPLLISNTMEMVVEPQLLDDASGLRQPLQQPGTNVESSSTDWDQWLAAGTADAMNYNNELNQMAWTNWETFVDDFHASAEFLPEQERGIQDFNLW